MPILIFHLKTTIFHQNNLNNHLFNNKCLVQQNQVNLSEHHHLMALSACLAGAIQHIPSH